MNGEYWEQYMEAMDVKMQALWKVTTWKIVLRNEVLQAVNMLPFTWVLKLKRYPDGRPRQFKTQLCI